MTPTARVYRHARSPYWQAWFLAWDGARREWRAVTRSTKCRDQSEAVGIARELERLALEASGQSGEVRIGVDWAQRAVNSILNRAGVREVITGKPWDAYSQAWLTMRGRKTKPRTLEAYRSQVKLFTTWLGKDRHLPISAITGAMLQQWYEAMTAEGRSIATMNNAATTLSGIFERAREEGFCSRNPVALIDRGEAQSEERDEFTPADIAALLKYLREDPEREPWLTVTLLGLCTGQRLTDCASAQWSDIEQSEPAWTWNIVQGKTSARVRVPLVEPLGSHLRSLKAKSQSDAISPTLDGLPAGHVHGLSAQFKTHLEAAGIVGRTVKGKGTKGRAFNSKTFHSLRHTCNSLMANAGVSPDVRIAILGHATKKMNERYTHLSDSTTGQALVEAITKAVS